MKNQKISIAIDGPSAAGKSTIAKQLAAELGFVYVDTGALYRVIGLAALQSGVATTDHEGVAALLQGLCVDLRYIDGVQRVFLGERDVSEEIRLPEMSMAASNVSAYPEVRAFLLGLQRKLAQEHSVVMDGRDIGTVVLPDAKVKIFLTASSEERARRRYQEFAQKGISVDFDKLLEEIKQRDYNDSHRSEAPLRQAEDAVLVDSTAMSLQGVVDRIKEIMEVKV